MSNILPLNSLDGTKLKQPRMDGEMLTILPPSALALAFVYYRRPMIWFWYVLLVLVLVGGFVLNAMTLPGLWVMLAAMAGYVLLSHGQFIGWSTLLFLTVLALIAEVADTIAGGAGAKRANASSRGRWGAFLGGILGGIFLTFLIPFFIIGTIVGICVGCFLGALIAELSTGRDTAHAVRVGAGAAVGRIAGLMAKMVLGTVILLIGLFAAFPHHLWTSRAPTPVARPATKAFTTSAAAPATRPAVPAPATAPGR
jgi:hypothetical protein